LEILLWFMIDMQNYITANKDQGSITTSEVVYAVERDEMLVGNPNAQLIGFPLPGASNNGFYSPGGFNATGPTLPPNKSIRLLLMLYLMEGLLIT